MNTMSIIQELRQNGQILERDKLPKCKKKQIIWIVVYVVKKPNLELKIFQQQKEIPGPDVSLVNSTKHVIRKFST